MMDLLQNFSDHFFENGALSALIAFVVIVVLALVVLRVVHRIFNSLVEKERIDATAAAFIRRIFLHCYLDFGHCGNCYADKALSPVCGVFSRQFRNYRGGIDLCCKGGHGETWSAGCFFPFFGPLR